MGTLKFNDWYIDETGQKICPVIGQIVNGVILGDPSILEDGSAFFEDSRIPNGVIDKDGIITQ
jgi:hypothetical protein